MSTADDIFRSSLAQLPSAERAELASLLLRSLDDGGDDDAQAAWEAELQRRVAAIEQGLESGRPADEVFAALRKRSN